MLSAICVNPNDHSIVRKDNGDLVVIREAVNGKNIIRVEGGVIAMSDDSIAGITVPAVTIDHMQTDLRCCLEGDGRKQDKRLLRWGCLCRLIEMVHGAAPQPELILPPPINIQITPDQVRDFIRRSYESAQQALVMNRGDVVRYFQEDDADDSVKKAIEAELTSQVNRDLLFHRITCRAVLRVWERLSRKKDLAELIAARDVILVFKGSVVQRTRLMTLFPEHAESINMYFKCGGDNDCCIYVNPHLGLQRQGVQDCISRYLRKELLSAAAALRWGSVATRTQEIKTITVAGVRLNVRPHVRRGFSLRYTGNSMLRHGKRVYEVEKTLIGDASPLYVTSNNTLAFVDAVGHPIQFALHRVRVAFLVSVAPDPVGNDDHDDIDDVYAPGDSIDDSDDSDDDADDNVPVVDPVDPAVDPADPAVDPVEVEVSAELIDVAVTGDNDYQTRTHFEDFKSGKYVQPLGM